MALLVLRGCNVDFLEGGAVTEQNCHQTFSRLLLNPSLFYLCLSCMNSGFACKCEGDGEILAADGKKLQCLGILKNPELEGDKFM